MFFIVVAHFHRLIMGKVEIGGDELKLCISVHDISLYINSIFYCHFPCAFISFPYTYDGKSGNWYLFLCYCRYFEKSFTEIVLE